MPATRMSESTVSELLQLFRRYSYLFFIKLQIQPISHPNNSRELRKIHHEHASKIDCIPNWSMLCIGVSSPKEGALPPNCSFSISLPNLGTETSFVLVTDRIDTCLKDPGWEGLKESKFFDIFSSIQIKLLQEVPWAGGREWFMNRRYALPACSLKITDP